MSPPSPVAHPPASGAFFLLQISMFFSWFITAAACSRSPVLISYLSLLAQNLNTGKDNYCKQCNNPKDNSKQKFVSKLIFFMFVWCAGSHLSIHAGRTGCCESFYWPTMLPSHRKLFPIPTYYALIYFLTLQSAMEKENTLNKCEKNVGLLFAQCPWLVRWSDLESCNRFSRIAT